MAALAGQAAANAAQVAAEARKVSIEADGLSATGSGDMGGGAQQETQDREAQDARALGGADEGGRLAEAGNDDDGAGDSSLMSFVPFPPAAPSTLKPNPAMLSADAAGECQHTKFHAPDATKRASPEPPTDIPRPTPTNLRAIPTPTLCTRNPRQARRQLRRKVRIGVP